MDDTYQKLFARLRDEALARVRDGLPTAEEWDDTMDDVEGMELAKEPEVVPLDLQNLDLRQLLATRPPRSRRR